MQKVGRDHRLFLGRRPRAGRPQERGIQNRRQPESPRQLEIDKHWYKFMLWGRLGYDPTLDRAFFEKHLALRYPLQPALLYDTWQTASKIIPLINTWHWRDWDHQWSPEACTSKKEGYHTVNHFIEFWPLQGRRMQSIRDYVKNPDSDAASPFDVADQLDALAEETLQGIAILSGGTGSTPSAACSGLGKVALAPPSREFQQTLGDLQAFAHLGQYYADKIRGSTAVHQFRVTGKKDFRKEAVKHLKAAVRHWVEYADVASTQYETQLLARTSWLDWSGVLLDFAKADVEIAKKAEHNVFPPSVVHSRAKLFE